LIDQPCEWGESVEPSESKSGLNVTHEKKKKAMKMVIEAQESVVTRAYSKVRFGIIDINILTLLCQHLGDRRKILDVGCGYGLLGLYLGILNRGVEYVGYDLDSRRIELAGRAAERLGLRNVAFYQRDARDLEPENEFEAIMMVDLLHHIDDESKKELLSACARHVGQGGRLIIKDVTTRPLRKLAFTWVLDVLVTRGFRMWYWNEKEFRDVLQKHFLQTNVFPITHRLPYPHILYVCENCRA
jgi:2-polyprenyl-3-methyl-5-hydroxy-6-metoxy-1,4-benzoquinol methylase